jgi:Dual specificity phosphatase, catalytic domain
MSAHSINNSESIRIYFPDLKQPVKSKTAECFNRVISDTYTGLSSARLMRAIVFGASAFGGFAASAYLGLTPPGWITTLTLVAGFALYGFFSGGSGSLHRKDIFQEIGCELGAAARLVGIVDNGYSEISWKGKKPGSGAIFLGPMINRLSVKNGPKAIAHRAHLGAVLSVNAAGKIDQKGERGCYGLMHAPTAQDWQQQEIDYAEIDIPDHETVGIEKLDAAADFIDYEVGRGRNIYVHCKAGRSRSAAAVAAYMIKYGKLDADRAVRELRRCRPSIRLHKKQERLDCLRVYERFCKRTQEPRSHKIHRMDPPLPLRWIN